MKKFRFLFLAALIAVMFIGCAQSADDDTPIISDAQPTIVNVTVTKITDNYKISDSGTEIIYSTNKHFTILNVSTPIGNYDSVFLPDEIELEYSNGEKRLVSIKPGLNCLSETGIIKFNGLLDIFLNGLDVGNTVLKWTTFYKYK